MSPEIERLPSEFREDVEKAVGILRGAGCREAYVFGSVAEGSAEPDSDVDVAVRGCPRGEFFKLQGRLLTQLKHAADLIDLDREPELADFLEREGTLVHVG